MGEAWSDWYAMDYLTANEPAEGRSGGRRRGPAVELHLRRTDRLAARAGARLPGRRDGQQFDACGDGGFTYADYGKVLGTYGPEVHADGEIWGQTLWDLRTALIRAAIARGDGAANGAVYARQLVTDAMRLSPSEPSFLDMRDAILTADSNVGGSAHDVIWQVFAARGMGYYATTENGWDPAPVADFSTPPSGATTTVSGTVTDADSGRAVAGVVVALPGQTERSATTDAAGHYAITNALAGVSYPRIVATRNGYDDAIGAAVTPAGDGSTVANLTVKRNWALYSGGTTVDFGQLTGPDLTALQCGPEYAIDGHRSNGWGSYQPNYDGSAHAAYGMPVVARGARRVVLRLPTAIDVSGVAIDPGAVCGDDDSASLGSFQLDTSVDGSTWHRAADGAFGSANNHRRNSLSVASGATAGVKYVRLTMLSPQGTGRSAAYFMDMAELAVYGTPTAPVVNPPDPPDPPGPGPGPDPDPDPGVTPVVPGPGPTVTNPPPTPRPNPTPDPNAEALRLTNVAIVLPKRRSLATVLSRKGVPVRVRASRRVKVTATVTLPAATARKLRLTRQRKGTVAIARLSNAAVAAGKATVLYVRLPRNTAAWITRAKVTRLTFGVALLATDNAGKITSRILRATAKR